MVRTAILTKAWTLLFLSTASAAVLDEISEVGLEARNHWVCSVVSKSEGLEAEIVHRGLAVQLFHDAASRFLAWKYSDHEHNPLVDIAIFFLTPNTDAVFIIKNLHDASILSRNTDYVAGFLHASVAGPEGISRVPSGAKASNSILLTDLERSTLKRAYFELSCRHLID